MSGRLGFHLDLEPERPELPLRAPAPPATGIAVIVRQFDPNSVWYRHHADRADAAPAAAQERAAK
jgi:hypothetical protein